MNPRLGDPLALSRPYPHVSIPRFRRALGAAFALAAAVTTGAALLQWWWAGWSVYAGPGPPLGTRWLLTSSLGAALLLPPGAAIGGAWSARRLADSGLLEQLKITRWSASRLALLVAFRALQPVFLALVVSASGWLCLSLAAPSTLHRGAGLGGAVTPGAIGAAHGLAAVIVAAFGLWGAALAAGKRGRESSPWGSPRRLGSWGLAAQVVLTLGPWLVGPLLPHLSRPERALDAVLVLNPATAVGAALGMDLLRSPRLYDLTRAPEYWYTYPPGLAVAAVYGLLALAGAYRLRKQIEAE